MHIFQSISQQSLFYLALRHPNLVPSVDLTIQIQLDTLLWFQYAGTMKYLKETIFLILLSPPTSSASECVRWFLDSGLLPGQSDCEIKCSISPTDMGNFHCPERCANLCEQNLSDQVLEYAPRLNQGDKALISRFPIQALKIYRAKDKADDLTIKVFKTTGKNDESDAFRHFVWSALITQDLGEKDAKMFLNAHEIEPGQSSKEKEMDLKNNEYGVEYILSRKTIGKPIEIKDIEVEALLRLRSGQLVVIEKKFEKIPNGYYSK